MSPEDDSLSDLNAAVRQELLRKLESARGGLAHAQAYSARNTREKDIRTYETEIARIQREITALDRPEGKAS